MLNLSTPLAPLHKLLSKGAQSEWGDQQHQAFATVETQLSSSELLVRCDPEVHLVLCCDALPYSLSVVLAHHFEDGIECAIVYMSWSLAAAE